MSAITLNPRIVEACRATRGLKGDDAIAWAIEHGWPWGYTYVDKDTGQKKRWAWCAMAASMRVYMASNGAVSLAFGRKRNLRVSRFGDGNASVPKLCADALELDLITQDPAPGMLVIVEVRGRNKKTGRLADWKGKRCHIGIVTAIKLGKGGKPVSVRCHEGNLGGHDVADFKRKLVAGPEDKERILFFIDCERFVAARGIDISAGGAGVGGGGGGGTGSEAASEPVAPDAPADVAPEPGELADTPELPLGADYMAIPASGGSETIRARAVAEQADDAGRAQTLLVPVGDDGEPVPGIEPTPLQVVGCWGGSANDELAADGAADGAA